MDVVIDASKSMQAADLWQRAPDLMREEMLRATRECDLLLEGELKQRLPRGAGGLHGAGVAGSVFTEEHALADNVIGLTASPEPYAEYLELGTKPHWVNKAGIQSIADWVRAKLGFMGEEATGIAHAIGWNIHEEGTDPQPVWEETYMAILPTIQRKFDAAVARVAARLFGAGA